MALTGSSRGAYGDESPEALRRRADVLLDEMMLGGVDTGAAGPYGGPALAGAAVSGGNGNGAAHVSPGAQSAPHSDELQLDYDGASHSFNGSLDEANAPSGGEPLLPPRATSNHLVSAEERYAQLAGARPSVDAPPSAPNAPVRKPAPPAPGQVQAVNEPQAALGGDGSYAGNYTGGYSTVAVAGSTAAASTAVRRQSPSLASQMAVGVRAANRSNLLPRDHENDADTMQQEIGELLRAVSSSLPQGSEAVERSRHLLSKAQKLLESDPTRTAEVDYYLQQVRRIVQRTRQTAQWSALYRKRLSVYLWAWLLLASLVVAAVAINPGSVVEFFTQLFDAPELGLLAQQAPVVLAGAFAGALGASLSALFSMQRRGRREHGYFDRKYGLRGLLLPLLGMFFGGLLALLAAVIYIVAEIDPTMQAWAVAVPAVMALIVGFGQEWMYGARA
jgi:hypothetical protein